MNQSIRRGGVLGLIFILGLIVGGISWDFLGLEILNPLDVSENEGKCLADDEVIVTKVLDGDTIVVEGGVHIRLLGIDADEKSYPCYEEAKTQLEDMILGKEIRLERDVSDVDMYGRCLRYVFLGNENINLEMVREGMAVARFYEPDVDYRTEISMAEQEAIENKNGCKWSAN